MAGAMALMLALTSSTPSMRTHVLTRKTESDTARTRTAIRRVEAAIPRTADRAAALFWLAAAHTSLGELDSALALIRACVALDEGFEPGSLPQLAPLTRYAEFRALAEKARRPSVHRARPGFTIAESDLIPEGLTYDSVAKVFYAGSEYRRKIVRVDTTGAATDFVKPGAYQLKPVGGVRVDPTDRSVWAATDSPELVHFDKGGRLIGRFSVSAPGPHILNDLVVRNGHEVYVTDTEGSEVYRLDPSTGAFSRLTFHRPITEPNGITLSPDGRWLFVADFLGVIRVDLEGGGATHDVPPSRGTTLAGIDGLYWYRGSLIGVQYGTGSFRVMRWPLSASGDRVLSAETLEQGTPLVRDPTTGAIVGDRFYFFANTGIDNLARGVIVDSTKLAPVVVAVVELGR